MVTWNVPLVSPIFLKRSLVFPILLFSSISLHLSLRKAFLSHFYILWDSAFRWVYLSFSPLPFTFLLFSALCMDSSDNHFPFLHFFFLRMVLIPASSTMSSTSVHSSSGSLSDLIPESNLSLSLNSRKGFDLGHTWIKWSSLNLVGRVHEIFWRMWLYEVLRRESEIWGHRKEFSDYVGQQSHFTQGR